MGTYVVIIATVLSEWAQPQCSFCCMAMQWMGNRYQQSMTELLLRFDSQPFLHGVDGRGGGE